MRSTIIRLALTRAVHAALILIICATALLLPVLVRGAQAQSVRTQRTSDEPSGVAGTDLGTLPGGSGSIAWDVNDWGEVVGVSDNSSGYNHAVVWINGIPTDLTSTLANDNDSRALGINNLHDIVGYIATDGTSPRAALWQKQNGVYTEQTLGIPPGADSTGGVVANAINDSRQIVGNASGPSNINLAFSWQAGVFQMLAVPLEMTQCFANGLNNQGAIVGSCINDTGDENQYVWPSATSTPIALLGLSDSAPTWVWDINDYGAVAGAGDTGGLLWPSSTAQPVDLTPISRAYGINEQGQITGLSSNGSVALAAVWQDGGVTDLVGPAGCDFRISWAYAINNSGVAVGEEDCGDVFDAAEWIVPPATTSGATPPAITSGATASTGMRVPFSATVTATGNPTPSLYVSGVLPSGVTFIDNGDGTATLSGEASGGSNGVYNPTITATNGVASPATQAFTLTVTSTTSAPAITNATSDTETFGEPFSFTVTTDGYPAPALSKTGTLPSGVTFTDNGNGTATLGGTPSASAAGVYNLTLKAKSSTGTATQGFTFTIVKVPVFKAVTIPVGHVGSAYSLTLKTSAYFTATLSKSGALPAGLSFTDNGDGTATIAGTPQAGSGAAYPVRVLATNQLGSNTKSFTIKVDEAPAISSASGTSATVGQPFSFTVTTTGYPTPSLAKSGTLPKGLAYHSATRTIDGTPAAGSQGTYTLIFTVKNSSGTVQQTFILTVN